MKFISFYPSATSRIIMRVKPSMRLIAARSECPFSCVLGMTSSTTTKIIAPAAKAKAYGRVGLMIEMASTPMTAAIGSTTADIQPRKKLFVRDIPSPRSGMDTAIPSGMF